MTLAQLVCLGRGGVSSSLQEKRKLHQNKRKECTEERDGVHLKNFPCKRFRQVRILHFCLERGEARIYVERNEVGNTESKSVPDSTDQD